MPASSLHHPPVQLSFFNSLDEALLERHHAEIRAYEDGLHRVMGCVLAIEHYFKSYPEATIHFQLEHDRFAHPTKIRIRTLVFQGQEEISHHFPKIVVPLSVHLPHAPISTYSLLFSHGLKPFLIPTIPGAFDATHSFLGNLCAQQPRLCATDLRAKLFSCLKLQFPAAFLEQWNRELERVDLARSTHPATASGRPMCL